jgi:hypothetical protein
LIRWAGSDTVIRNCVLPSTVPHMAGIFTAKQHPQPQKKERIYASYQSTQFGDESSQQQLHSAFCTAFESARVRVRAHRRPGNTIGMGKRDRAAQFHS